MAPLNIVNDPAGTLPVVSEYFIRNYVRLNSVLWSIPELTKVNLKRMGL